VLDLFRDHPGRLVLLATLLPLAAAAGLLAVAAVRTMLGGECRIPDFADRVVLFVMVVATVLCGSAFAKRIADTGGPWRESVEWVHLGPSRTTDGATLGYSIDTLTAAVAAMVTLVGSLIVLFSTGYMHDEQNATVDDHAIHHHRRGRYGRFFVYLALFLFSMLNLLIADNLLMIFISWELVGVCSFFLIGFYTERPTASTAANKAFLVNRIGDAGFLVALFIAWSATGTFDLASLSSVAAGPSGTLFGVCLFIGCMGKSAQIPLQTWLPDAMEGPTPVSALIHAATMVAAGVYLAGRATAVGAMTPDVLTLIAVVGAVTAFVSATTAMVQTDIKRVLAFSTCSQLGFMMVALGIGAWSAAFLHLLTHAFFKALLFLGAGSVIHGMHHEQDLRRMGGLRRAMPVTAYAMLIGVLAICGVPFFSGWVSKDQIVSHLFAYVGTGGNGVLSFVVFGLPIVTVGLTAFYMMRLWLMAFAGEPRDAAVGHAHESPAVMTIPLGILAIFSIAVAVGWPVWDADASWLGHLLFDAGPKTPALHDAAHANHLLAGGVALALAMAGMALAWQRHASGAFLRESNAAGWRKFLDHRWYFDAVYDAVFVRPTVALARQMATADKSKGDVGSTRIGYDLTTLDGLIAAPATFVRSLGGGLREANRGLPRGYVLAMALTVVAALGILSRFVR
jgi:NADH-quinone oxidoreductase subunit L